MTWGQMVNDPFLCVMGIILSAVMIKILLTLPKI